MWSLYTLHVARLIVNADDFGYTAGISQAVLELHAAGALSSTTAMACSAGLPQAPPPTLAVGCHVVLLDGTPASLPRKIPSLVQADAVFRPTLGRFAVDLLRGALSESELEQEAAAQIRSLQARGLSLTHLDTHKHTHLFPRVLEPLLRAARTCGVRAIRNPFEPAWSRAATGGASPVRRCELHLLGGYRERFLAAVKRAGMRTTSGTLGVLATGILDGPVLAQLLRALERHGAPEDAFELVCHPGYHDRALDLQRTRLRQQRETERTALLKQIPRWTASGAPHRLITFADL